MLWHRGDPAGWTRYKSLLVGTWFNSIGTGKIEDLRALLLRTPHSTVFKLAYTPHEILGNGQNTDRTNRRLDNATDFDKLKTFPELLTNTDASDVNKRQISQLCHNVQTRTHDRTVHDKLNKLDGSFRQRQTTKSYLANLTNKLVNRLTQWLIK